MNLKKKTAKNRLNKNGHKIDERMKKEHIEGNKTYEAKHQTFIREEPFES